MILAFTLCLFFIRTFLFMLPFHNIFVWSFLSPAVALDDDPI